MIRPGVPSIGNAISTAVHASSVINPAPGEPEAWKAALMATGAAGVKPGGPLSTMAGNYRPVPHFNKCETVNCELNTEEWNDA